MKIRYLPLLLIALLPSCARQGSLVPGGIYAIRSACPVVGIPAGTGDITLFSPAGRTDASSIDVSATMTNMRSACQDSGQQISSTVSFDVVAVRREAGPARQVALPYFNVVLRGGSEVAAKKVGYVGLNFPAGSLRAQTSGQVTAYVHSGAAALPPDIVKILTRQRKAGDPDAAVDPMSDPAVRDAVAKATFEHLVGFQMSDDQLRYNVTR